MANIVTESCANVDGNGNEDVKGSDSAENFQKFMYELLEKNGVMNDLRSHLRGHIVNVLRSAQTGDPTPCQKHFTQRLDLKFQALNILIAEYLLCLEFGYTLSVFVSEIPLANMVFSYAKTLMRKMDDDDSKLRFKDNDVWCILNYLGVKCDSEHASSIVEMYRLERNHPLLLCILKSARLCKEPISVVQQGNTSNDSLSSAKSSESDGSNTNKPSAQEKCRHYMICKTCQSKMAKIKEKYRKKKKEITKKMRYSSLNSLKVDSLMKNISVMETSLIDEMFEQLKSVYESEMELVKKDEDNRVRRSLAVHSTQLQKRREEMEESFKVREAELEKSVQQKKRFLWGLARSLREQHQHMTRAMQDIQAETNRLSAKEDSLKTQLAEAERILRERGEDMRRQISNELAILEQHLESMKSERDSINTERSLLEQYKDKTSNAIENDNLKSHYELLRNEFGILKKYLETAKLEPKCVIERSTITDLCGVTSRIDVVLNNGQDVDRIEDRVKPKQLVNDLKKQKNVNFSQSNLDEIYRERSQSRSRSSASSEGGDALFDSERDALQRLREENEQLRCFARQQREHIDDLASQRARLQAELVGARVAPATAPAPVLRPRTAPATVHNTLPPHSHRLGSSASTSGFAHGWRKGAGEEISLFSNAQPRILVPGDVVPFVGVLARHVDNRRYLINQWRSLRRRISPQGGVCKPKANSPEQQQNRTAVPGFRLILDQDNAQIDYSNFKTNDAENEAHSSSRPTQLSSAKREKSPKSVLREAKDKLRTQDCIKTSAPMKREKSPNSVLREAKLRLRKLEIEAEAVEKSYLDFRRKQDAFRNDQSLLGNDNNGNIRNDSEAKPNTSTYRRDTTYTKESTSQYEETKPSRNYEKYIKKFETTYNNIGEAYFKNRNTAAVRINPIPSEYSSEGKKRDNYIETPLNEFRKYYQFPNYSNTPQSVDPLNTRSKGTRKEAIRQAKHDKVKELELLKQNIGKIYNMPENAISDTPVESNNDLDIERNQSNDLDSQENNVVDNGESEAYQHCAQEDAIVEENVTNIESQVVEMVKSDGNENLSEQNIEDRNLLRIEVESISEINDVKVTESQTQDLMLVVKSSEYSDRDAEMSDFEFDKDNMPTQMTIIVSPKRSPNMQEILITSCDNAIDETESRGGNFSSRSRRGSESHKSSTNGKDNLTKSELIKSGINSGEFNESLKSKTTKNVLAVYHSENGNLSSVQMKIDITKEVIDNTLSELEQNEDPDYPDDFSADIENYNSDYNNTSAISQLKSSEEEQFWES